jgi:hypothetical protein
MNRDIAIVVIKEVKIMNREHFDIAIKVMQRVAEREYVFNMEDFREWLKTSPEFQAAGGSCNEFPLYEDWTGEFAIYKFLDINQDLSEELSCVFCYKYSYFYRSEIHEITAKMVAEKLIDIRDNPEKYGE